MNGGNDQDMLMAGVDPASLTAEEKKLVRRVRQRFQRHREDELMVFLRDLSLKHLLLKMREASG